MMMIMMMMMMMTIVMMMIMMMVVVVVVMMKTMTMTMTIIIGLQGWGHKTLKVCNHVTAREQHVTQETTHTYNQTNP